MIGNAYFGTVGKGRRFFAIFALLRKTSGLIYKETMIKIYGMHTCPDCTYVEEQVKGNERYEIIDIGMHVKNLKEFLKLRDCSPVFDQAKKAGTVGIPCFVLEDGTVTLSPEDAGLNSCAPAEGVSCSIDGKGC